MREFIADGITIMLCGLNFITYLNQIKGTIEMGGVYWTNFDVVFRLIFPMAGVYMSAYLLYDFLKKIYARIEEFQYKSELKKSLTYISFFYMSFIFLFTAIMVYFIIVKNGHYSFYTVTLWYIYYYGIMNLYAPML